jgi:hypothetical protein
MNKIPDNLISSKAPDECHQVLNALLLRWPVEPKEELSSALLDHLCHCRSCLRKWIALEAAADLASFPRDHSAEIDADSDLTEARRAETA